MRQLLLLRHARAPIEKNETDADRKLNAEGYEECVKVANYLNSNSIKISHIISSDSIRTRQTVGKILEMYEHKPSTKFIPVLYNASGDEIIEVIRSQSEDIQTLLVVGHNPGITTLMDLIHPSGSSDDIIKSRDFQVTCKLVWIEGEFDTWNQVGFTDMKIINTFFPTDSL